MTPLDTLNIPEFKNYQLTPQNKLCLPIDTTRLLIEIIGGLNEGNGEFSKSEFSSKIQIDGKYSLVIRYKREKTGKYHPTCALSFDYNDGNITINQLQGSKDKKVAFRFFSSFNTVMYYINLIEDSFSSRGVYVEVERFPTGLEGASYSSNAVKNYEQLRRGIENLNNKYLITKK